MKFKILMVLCTFALFSSIGFSATIGNWTYEEGSGTTSEDIATQLHNATWNSGNASFSTVSHSGTYSLNVSGDGGDVANSVIYTDTPINQSSPYGSLQAYINVQNGDGLTILQNDQIGVANHFLLSISAGTGKVFWLKRGDEGSLTSTADVTNGTWVHIVVTWNGTHDTMWIDGAIDQQQASVTGTEDEPYANRQFTPAGDFALIDDMSITDTAWYPSPPPPPPSNDTEHNITFVMYREDESTEFYCDSCFIEFDGDTFSWSGNNSMTFELNNATAPLIVKGDILNRNATEVLGEVTINSTQTIIVNFSEALVHADLLIINSSIADELFNESILLRLGYEDVTWRSSTSHPAPEEYSFYEDIIVDCGAITDDIEIAVRLSDANITTCIDQAGENLFGVTWSYDTFSVVDGSGSHTIWINSTTLGFYNSEAFDSEFGYRMRGASLGETIGSNVKNMSGTILSRSDKLLSVKGQSAIPTVPVYWFMNLPDNRKAIVTPSGLLANSINWYDPLVNVFVAYSNGDINFGATDLIEVSFTTVESICSSTDIPVDNVQCQINGHQCTTASENSTIEHIDSVPVNARAIGGWYNGSNYVYDIFKLNPAGFSMIQAGTNPPAILETNLYYNVYTFYDFPTSLSKVETETINFSADLSAEVNDVSGFDLIYNHCEHLPDNNALNYKIDIYSGFNLTHYKKADMGCIGNDASFFSAETFVHVDTLPKLDAYFNLDAHEFNGTTTVLRNELEIYPNHTAPLIFQEGTDRVFRNNLYVFWLNESNTPGMNWAILRDVFDEAPLRFTHFDEVVYLSYDYNKTSPAGCSVGEIPAGNYTYTCYSPAGYVFSENNDNVISEEVEIPPFNSIRVDLIKVRPLALGLILLTTRGEGNPVINAKCQSPYSVNWSDSEGLCILGNMPPESIVAVTINPYTSDLKPVTTAFETGDYYNSEGAGFDYRAIPNACSLFNGIFYETVYLDEIGTEKNIRFVVYDKEPDTTAFDNAVQTLINDQALWQEWFLKDYGILEADFNRIRDAMSEFTIQGATVSIDGDPEHSCVTGSDGTCSISWFPDFLEHNITASRYPEYIEYSETLPIVYFDGWLVFMRRNSSWWAEHPEGIAEDPTTVATQFGAGGDLNFWLGFLLMPSSIIFLLLSFISFNSGQSTLGIAFVSLMFIFLLPIWFAIMITVIVLMFITKSGRELIFGGASDFIGTVRGVGD